MESLSGQTAVADVGAESTGERTVAAAMRATLHGYFTGFGIADTVFVAALIDRFTLAAREAGDELQAAALAERAVADWFVGVFGDEMDRAELAADIGRLAALRSGVFARRPDYFLAGADLAHDAAMQLRRAMPQPPTVSLMTPMPTQSLARVSFVPSARRALALLQIRRV